MKLTTIKIKPQLLEIWKDIEGYEGLYRISTLGRVKSKYSNWKILKNIVRDDGYSYVTLCKKGNRNRQYIHRMVATAFISNSNNKPEVNHIDENPSNNNINNLEWVTRRENELHGTKIERGRQTQILTSKKRKEIIGISLGNSGLILEFTSLREAERNCFNRGSIVRCIEKNISHRGFKWFYLND